MPVLTLDGSIGEGGGQILRTALALALVTRQPFHMLNIRAGREKPGLQRQHLAAVRAAADVAGAEVAGAAIGSGELWFKPGAVRPGRYQFAIGTAGSATLVFQTVLPALMLAPAPSLLTLEGGTHNPLAPPFDFIAEAFLPLVRRHGPRVDVALERAGFYPAGGGRFSARIEPAGSLSPVELLERGGLASVRGRALVSALPRSIAERELAVIARRMRLKPDALAAEPVASAGPGNVVLIEVESEHVTEVFAAFGQRGIRAEKVADEACRLALGYLEAAAPVGQFLADQLLLPMALAGRGRFRTLAPTPHATTNIEVINRFLGMQITATRLSKDVWEIAAGG